MNPSVSDKNRKPIFHYLPILGSALLLWILMYKVVINEIPGTMTDYNGHVYTYLATFTGEDPFKAWMMSPYFLWHFTALFFRLVIKLPIEDSAAISSCLFYMASYFVTVYMAEKWCSHKSISVSVSYIGFISLALTIMQPIWIPLLDAGVSGTVGVFSFNPLYSPTHMAARPFALLCFMLVADLWEIQDGAAPVFFDLSRRKNLIVLAIVLFVSSTAKPVFAEMFIPAVGILMLIKTATQFIKNRDLGKKYLTGFLVPAFLAALPTILFILVMYLLYVKLEGSYADSEGVILTPFLMVWAQFSENIPLSMLFMMSFPIYLLVIDSRNYLSSNIGRLGVVSFVIGFLEAAFLGEGGVKIYHGNFIWPMMFGSLILWASSILHFLTMEKKASSVLSRILILIGWILILIHVYYGFRYFFNVFGWDFIKN